MTFTGAYCINRGVNCTKNNKSIILVGIRIISTGFPLIGAKMWEYQQNSWDCTMLYIHALACKYVSILYYQHIPYPPYVLMWRESLHIFESQFESCWKE